MARAAKPITSMTPPASRVARTPILRTEAAAATLVRPQATPSRVKPRPACFQFQCISRTMAGRTTPRLLKVPPETRKNSRLSAVKVIQGWVSRKRIRGTCTWIADVGWVGEQDQILPRKRGETDGELINDAPDRPARLGGATGQGA